MPRSLLPVLCALAVACPLAPSEPSPLPAPAQTQPAPAPASPSAVFQQGDKPPAEIVPFVLPGYEVLDLATGDLDADGQDDALLVLEKSGENVPGEEVPRPLLLLRRADGKLEQVHRNDNVVYCASCGGVMGDPYQGIVVEKGRFKVSHYGGSSWRWSNVHTFVYDAAKKEWFLDSEENSSENINEPGSGRQELIPREELGDIALGTFNYQADTKARKWRVAAKKTSFYDQPSLKASPRKAYLVEGDTVDGARELVNFVRVSFTNKEGQSTEGYLLKKDLTPVQ